MAEIIFARSRPFTLGVELEFQILDRETLDLAPMAPAIMKKAQGRLAEKLAPEFLRSIIEVQTGICKSVDEAADDLRRTVYAAEQTAADCGCLLYSASLHPFAEPAQQMLSEGERYGRIMDELQYVGRQFISQGLHVHVGMENGETAIVVCDTLQAYLPVMLGISTSSPYFRGEDTGLCSYRTKLFEALPLAGLAGFIGSWQGYQNEIAMLKERQVVREPRDLWWDVRPSPGLGTVEIRTCDIPSRFQEIFGLTALLQALTAAIVDKRVRHAPVSIQLLRCNKWQAVRHGLEGRFNDPLGLLPTATQTIRGAAGQMLEVLEPYMHTFGAGHWADSVQHVLDYGTSTKRQRQLVSEGATFKEMILQIRSEYWT